MYFYLLWKVGGKLLGTDAQKKLFIHEVEQSFAIYILIYLKTFLGVTDLYFDNLFYVFGVVHSINKQLQIEILAFRGLYFKGVYQAGRLIGCWLTASNASK